MLIIMELVIVPQIFASSCSVNLGQIYFMVSWRMRQGKRKKKCLITSRTLKIAAKYKFCKSFYISLYTRYIHFHNSFRSDI